MTIRELSNVCDGCQFYMHNKNNGENITIPVPSKGSIFQFVRIGGFMYEDALKVKDVYADCGVQCEVKFNKEFWHIAKKIIRSNCNDIK